MSLALGKLLIDGAVGFFTRRQEIKKAEHDQKVRRIQQGDDNAAQLDRLSIASRGWKDDYLLIITTLPMIACFVPGMLPQVQAGFMAMRQLPEYYWYALGMIYIDTFGFRRMLRVVVERWLNNKFGGAG